MNQDDRHRLDGLEKKIDDIRDNHLAHIYERLGQLNGRWSILIPLSICILGSIIGLYMLLLRG